MTHYPTGHRKKRSLKDDLNCILLHLTWDVNKHYKHSFFLIQFVHPFTENTEERKNIYIFFLFCQIHMLEETEWISQIVPAESSSFMYWWERHYWQSSFFSLLSRMSWILLKFSSCWPNASSMIPMGDFLSPALSILFSSLFLMFRRRSDACAKITEMQNDKAL